MAERVVACPSCGQKARFDDTAYYHHRVLIRCRRCLHQWWEIVFPPSTDDEVEERVRREQARHLARFLVREILHYHRNFIRQAQTRAEVLEALKEDIDLARAHYLQRVSPDLRTGPDYFTEAVEEFLLKGKV